ncbi:MAG: tRNA pseudouridine(38-40) synthase TruA [Cyanobacteriota bacterium]
MKFKFYIEYDGTNFSGWQKQKNAKTIQGTLIEAIENVLSENDKKDEFIDFQGSGRTDSGVHAIEQVAHLECKTKLSPSQIRQKVNDKLPHSINISKVEKADDRFHARHSAKSRQYVYKLSKKRNPFQRKFVWTIKDNLNILDMQEAAKSLIGKKDFISFSDKPSKEKSTIVVIESVTIEESDEMVLISIKASHFLWKMVRRIVGVLVEIGKGTLDTNFIDIAIEEHIPEVSAYSAPSMGLFLQKVEY